MAIQYSEAYLALQYRSPRLLLLKIIIRLFPVIEFVRRCQRRLLAPPAVDVAAMPVCRVTEALEAGSEHYRASGWVFVNNIFEPTFHEFLIKHWPKRRYFTAPFDVHKAFDKGFRWVDVNPAGDRWGELLADDAKNPEEPNYPAYMREHPHLKSLFDYLRSEEFIRRLKTFSGRPEPLAFNRFQLTTSYPGSLVAPHRDSPQAGKHWVSLLFYVAASGGPDSGGTAILNDNRFEEVIFEPSGLTNNCLIFDPSAPFFHGVRPIAFGKYRWMLSAEYVSGKNA